MSEAKTQQQVATVSGEARLGALLQTKAIKSRFDEVLGKRAPAFMSSIISAVAANKDLKNCEPMSVIGAAAVAASLDLPINPGLGFAHIVPYKGVAQFQIGWKGFVQLAMRTGKYQTINVTPIYEGQIKHHNPITGDMEFNDTPTSDKKVGYILFFRLINGYEKYFYMTKEQADAHGKRYSASYKAGYGKWVDDFDAMALKTVVKLGLSKYGILSVEMQTATEYDQAKVDETGRPSYIDAEVDGETTEKPAAADRTGPSRLAGIVDAQTAPSAEDKPL